MQGLKAEAMARKQCEAGLASYLATQHKSHRRKSFAAGLLGGGVTMVGLIFTQARLGQKINGLSYLPLAFGVIGGWGYGLLSQDDDDAMREADFNEQCQEFEAEEDEICECGSDIDDCDCEDCDNCGCERSL